MRGNNEEKKKRKQKEKVKVICEKCKQETNHIITKEETRYEYEEINGIQTRENRQIVKCCGCDTFSFRKVYFCSEDYIEDWNNGEVLNDGTKIDVFPKRDRYTITEKSLYHSPKLIKKIYKEIINAYNEKCYLLSVIGIRALLEGLCKEEDIKGKDLVEKINGLIEKKIITENTAKNLHQIRKLGNETTHELEELNAFEIEQMIRIIENIIENVYELEEKQKT